MAWKTWAEGAGEAWRGCAQGSMCALCVPPGGAPEGRAAGGRALGRRSVGPTFGAPDLPLRSPDSDSLFSVAEQENRAGGAQPACCPHLKGHSLRAACWPAARLPLAHLTFTRAPAAEWMSASRPAVECPGRGVGGPRLSLVGALSRCWLPFPALQEVPPKRCIDWTCRNTARARGSQVLYARRAHRASCCQHKSRLLRWYNSLYYRPRQRCVFLRERPPGTPRGHLSNADTVRCQGKVGPTVGAPLPTWSTRLSAIAAASPTRRPAPGRVHVTWATMCRVHATWAEACNPPWHGLPQPLLGARPSYSWRAADCVPATTHQLPAGSGGGARAASLSSTVGPS